MAGEGRALWWSRVTTGPTQERTYTGVGWPQPYGIRYRAFARFDRHDGAVLIYLFPSRDEADRFAGSQPGKLISGMVVPDWRSETAQERSGGDGG